MNNSHKNRDYEKKCESKINSGKTLEIVWDDFCALDSINNPLKIHFWDIFRMVS